jgi:hypothetical protein
MTTLTDLEERLRRGLQAAGEALPADSHEPPTPDRREGDGRHRRPRGLSSWHRRVVGVAALVVAGGLVTAAVIAARDGSEPAPAVRSAAETTGQPTTTTEPHRVRPTNGMVPGQAVVVGGELRTYGPDGAQTGAVELTRFTFVQGASSDLDGGWVVCGTRTLTPAEREENLARIREEVGELPDGAVVPESLDQLVWFPAGREPVVVDDNTMCMAQTLHVVDSAAGPVAVYADMGGRPSGPLFEAHAVVLATGQERELPIPGSNELVRWSVTSDRFLTAHGDEMHVYDLTTGDELPIADIPVTDPSDVVLSPDGSSVAVITGGASGPTAVGVYDVATGAQRYTEQLSMAAEGAELSYDGTTLAYGNAYDRYGPMTVVDLASGARHAIDANGTLL